MRNVQGRMSIILILMSFWLWPAAKLQAQENTLPKELEGIGITEHLGDKIPAGLQFVNEKGETVTLDSYIGQGRPVILNLVYYSCPMLCTLVLNGMVEGLKQVGYEPGQQFDIVSVSIDPRDTPEIAAMKKANYVKEYGRPSANMSWHFLTGQEPEIKKLTEAIGFKYRWDEQQQQYAHAAAIFILTPEGVLSRYLYGITFQPQDLRLGLLEASEGKIGSPIEKLLLFCYQYDPVGKKYALYATNVMRLGAAFTVLILGAFLGIFWRAERQKSSQGAVP
jgi:protein SCO1/2